MHGCRISQHWGQSATADAHIPSNWRQRSSLGGGRKRVSRLICCILYRCPTCTQPLHNVQKHELQCDNGHTILRAREGHLHLLPSGRKAPRQPPGDSDAMVRARRAFFEAGHYDAIAGTLSSAVLRHVQGKETVTVLDAGCGEGMYLGHLHGQITAAGMECQGYGVDVAKLAVRLAAKRYRQLSFAVASSYMLPFDDQVFDAVITVFAPCPLLEMSRVLCKGGLLVSVTPGKDHLDSIKSLLYSRPKPFDEKLCPENELTEVALQLRGVERVRKDLILVGDDAMNLLTMTPYLWHASKELQATFQDMKQLSTTLDVMVATYEKVA